jgi:protein CLEC16A
MLTYFLNYMRQKNGRYICVQILQTLNILFENIRNETSLCKCMLFLNKTIVFAFVFL